MSKNLQFKIYFKKNNEACLVFKWNRMLYRLNHLMAPLPFVANMMQLLKAMEADANQNCGYELKNSKGLAWILNCRFTKGIISLDLWCQQFGAAEVLETHFDWRGTLEEFRNAVVDLIAGLGKYRFALL